MRCVASDMSVGGINVVRVLVPLWEQPRALLASLTNLSLLVPTRLHPVFQTILASGRCQLTRFGLLPSYVVDSSSPKQPRKGGGRGSG